MLAFTQQIIDLFGELMVVVVSRKNLTTVIFEKYASEQIAAACKTSFPAVRYYHLTQAWGFSVSGIQAIHCERDTSVSTRIALRLNQLIASHGMSGGDLSQHEEDELEVLENNIERLNIPKQKEELRAKILLLRKLLTLSGLMARWSIAIDDLDVEEEIQ